MAEVLNDGEFCLPPRLDLSSPVDSVEGSTESGSDEDDYLVGLTSEMVRYILEDDFGRKHPAFASENSKDWVFSISPDSTLRASRSSHGSSNYQSRVSLCSAAEEAARVRKNEESYGGFKDQTLLDPPAKKPSPNRHHSLSLRATQFQQVQQNQLMKQHNPRVWGGKTQQLQNSTNRFPSAWPPLQQQPQSQNGSGMRAVFSDSPAGKRGCAGTGVFLPTRTGGTAEPRKKQACPVLVPARVFQALNLNLNEINAQPRFKASVTTDSGAGSRLRSGGNDLAKQNNFRQLQGISHEIRLPQEWTY